LVGAVALGLAGGFVAEARLAVVGGDAGFAGGAEWGAGRAEGAEAGALVAGHAGLVADGAGRAFAALGGADLRFWIAEVRAAADVAFVGARAAGFDVVGLEAFA